jgi:hypothetical protein
MNTVWLRKLNLVDLAGSESAKMTGAAGERFKEAKNINSDLLDLGLVIRNGTGCPQEEFLSTADFLPFSLVSLKDFSLRPRNASPRVVAPWWPKSIMFPTATPPSPGC